MFGSQQTSIPSSTRSVFPFQVQLSHKVHHQVHLIPFIVEDNFTIAGQVEIKLNVGCWKSQMKKIELQKCRCQSPATTSPCTSMTSSFTRKMWLCRWQKKDNRKLTLTLHPSPCRFTNSWKFEVIDVTRQTLERCWRSLATAMTKSANFTLWTSPRCSYS